MPNTDHPKLPRTQPQVPRSQLRRPRPAEVEDRGAAEGLAGALEALRKRLVDTGTRNRLVHVNRSAKRANVLNVVRGRSDDIYDLLRLRGRKMRFQPTGHDEDDEERDVLPFRLDGEVDHTSKYRDAYLQTELGPQSLEKRVLKLWRDSRTTEEEQGANFLFLALGFLRWYEDGKSEVLREAPLVLLPVQLTRPPKRFFFNLKARQDDVTTNVPLQERLKGDFGIELPEIDDSEEWNPSDYFDQVASAIEGKKRWTIDKDGMQLGFFSFIKALMYRDLKEENWPDDALVRNALIRGLLDANRGVDEPPLRFQLEDRLDEHLEPENLVHVVDADASQAKVIEEVRSGRNLVVQGPPGTGKSQTITNLIAAAVHDGRTVLFVAEKMAALNVVHDRLVKAGLRDVCLELHSRKANKKAFYGELQRTLESGRAVPETPAALPAALTEVRERLNGIDNFLHERLDGRDYTPFEVISDLCRCRGSNLPPARVEPSEREGLAQLTNEEVKETREAIRSFAEALKVTGRPSEHPFFGVQRLDLQPMDQDRLRLELGSARDAVVTLQQVAEPIAERLGVHVPLDLLTVERVERCLKEAGKSPQGVRERAVVFAACSDSRRLMDALGLFKTWVDSKGAADAFLEVAWATPVAELRLEVAAGLDSLLARWFGKYRRASRQFGTLLKGKLPPSPEKRLALVDELLDVQAKRDAFAQEENWLAEALGSLWRGERTEVDALLQAGDWTGKLRCVLRDVGLPLTSDTVKAVCGLTSDATTLLARLREARDATSSRLGKLDRKLGLEDDNEVGLVATTLEQLRERLGKMHRQIAGYEDWKRLQKCREVIVARGLGAFVDRMESEGESPDDAEQEFGYAVAEERWKHARLARPQLDDVASADRHRRVKEFQELEERRFTEVRRLIRHRHLSQLPTGTAGEMAFLKGEFAKKRRHRSVRRAFQAAPTMIPRIKPVLLMSPISIAQFLPANGISFDLLLIDEASQVRPEDALGAVARARQIVVVGDDKQLPPTNFFDRLVDNRDTEEDKDDDAEMPPSAAGAAEMESILKLAEARGLRQAMLKWHYRSRDPSLIRMANIEFYETGLVLPPSPLEKDDCFGMKLRRVQGVYSSQSHGSGRAGTNRLEAEHLADALSHHSRSEAGEGRSVGVVAFSKAQSDMITEVLEMRRRRDSALDALLREGKTEEVFVKNIENVQGDERDVILISVGYGPHEPNGRLSSMRFGPVNNEGGERRLNVLFSRARMRCEIFVSFDWRDIDLNRTRAEGPRVLRKFLRFAETGQLGAEQEPTGLGPDSPLEEDVAQVIAERGYPVDHQVGSAGFRIDLGVRDPGKRSQYILAVECDGASYHGALWARERDRQRQQVLEQLGWRFHRIWSTDWFYRRQDEIERLDAALSAARAAMSATGGFRPPGANRSGGSSEVNDRSGWVDGGGPPQPALSEVHETPPEPPRALVATPYEPAGVRYPGWPRAA